MTSPFSLAGKNALITGSNTGIGFGIAKGMAAAGAKVAIHGRNPDKTKKALSTIRELNSDCMALNFDIADITAIPEFYQKVSEAMKGIDILVNNAGINRRGPAESISVDTLNEIIDVNLRAPFVLSQEFARERISQKKGGRIIMIGSLLSEVARPTVAPYTATKGGIRQMVKALAVDWADYGILVNGIGPGYIDTEMNEALVNNKEFSDFVLKRTLVRRWGTPEDLAGPAIFLASEAGSFVNGQMIYADGGILASL